MYSEPLKFIWKVLLISYVLCLSACQLGGAGQGHAAGVSLQEFRFHDGQSAISLALRKPASGTVENLLFVIPGSDCISMYPLLPDYFRGLEGQAGATQIYILHKRQIHPFSRGSYCGAAFTEADHLQQWLADQREFIQQKIALHRQQVESPKRIVLLGISEGAETATMLAKELPFSHLVLLSHSGKAPLQVYRQLAQTSPKMAQAWQSLSQALYQDPASAPELMHGRSMRYWRELLDLPQTATLLNLTIPVLIAAGGHDPVLPADTAEFLSELNQESRGRIQIFWFQRADHGLFHPDHAYLPDFMYLMEKWWMAGQSGFDHGFFSLE